MAGSRDSVASGTHEPWSLNNKPQSATQPISSYSSVPGVASENGDSTEGRHLSPVGREVRRNQETSLITIHPKVKARRKSNQRRRVIKV